MCRFGCIFFKILQRFNSRTIDKCSVNQKVISRFLLRIHFVWKSKLNVIPRVRRKIKYSKFGLQTDISYGATSNYRRLEVFFSFCFGRRKYSDKCKIFISVFPKLFYSRNGEICRKTREKKIIERLSFLFCFRGLIISRDFFQYIMA